MTKNLLIPLGIGLVCALVTWLLPPPADVSVTVRVTVGIAVALVVGVLAWGAQRTLAKRQPPRVGGGHAEVRGHNSVAQGGRGTGRAAGGDAKVVGNHSRATGGDVGD